MSSWVSSTARDICPSRRAKWPSCWERCWALWVVRWGWCHESQVCHDTGVSLWMSHVIPDIINVAVSTSNLSTKTRFRQKLKCNDSFIIRAFKVVIPQILRIIFVRFPKALPFCFLEITKSLTLLLINLAVLMFHARPGTCKAFYVFQICSVLHAHTLLHHQNLIHF